MSTPLVKAGAYIGFDRLAYGHLDNPVKNSVKNIVELVSKGYINRIFLSHDWATYLAFWDSWDKTVSQDYLNLDIDFTYISREVIPMLKAAGIGVAMGNASEKVQSVADFVTDTVDNSGLYKALKHFGVI